jgi:trigger factor
MTTEVVQHLEKLQHKIRLHLPESDINKEINKRLRQLAPKVNLNGFRPGNAPLSVIELIHGDSVRSEVMNTQIDSAFERAVKDSDLKVAGFLQIKPIPQEEVKQDYQSFDIIFDVYPVITLPDLGSLIVEEVEAKLTEADIEDTVNVLRKQNSTFTEAVSDALAANGDKVMVDFKGSIGDKPFEGDSATDFQFVLGEGQMLPEFEEATQGMQVGEEKTFDVNFPKDYHGKEVDGKTATFFISLKKIEKCQLPTVDAAFIKSLNIKGDTVEDLHKHIRQNMEREAQTAIDRIRRAHTLEALEKASQTDLPQSVVRSEAQRIVKNIYDTYKQYNEVDLNKVKLSFETFIPKAERNIKLALLIDELLKVYPGIKADQEEITAYLQNKTQAYEDPQAMISRFTNDADLMQQIKNIVLENKIAQFILSKAQVTKKEMSFKALMALGNNN